MGSMADFDVKLPMTLHTTELAIHAKITTKQACVTITIHAPCVILPFSMHPGQGLKADA